MTFDRMDLKIAQCNQRLKLARIGVRVYRKEQRLLLRATFPPRPGSTRTAAYQQWLALGTYASAEGLKHAEALAKTIGGDLARRVFDWTPYLKRQQPLPERPLSEQLAAFRDYFLTEQGYSLSTLQSTYVPYFNQLTRTATAYPHLDLKTLIERTLREVPAQPRGRQLACTAFRQFLLFVGLDASDLGRYRGSYNQRQQVPRQLPDDATIAQWYQRIPNPHWRLVYGLMATYGLRPHECFSVDLTPLQSGQSVLWVGQETKTGARETWPFYPEWVEQFALVTSTLPTVLPGTPAKALGKRVNTQFYRYRIPFNPYLLRHAWAVRTIHFGLDSSLVAPMMGHSVQVHTGVYHHWLTRRDQQAAVERALPTAPAAPKNY
ncbi:hypothetical protein [Candidatus Cyanaurora vandensis]|uniref:hypothetical protein n=1 Tax=Candidatus Cyanaurora vandensis TaxID=2714958 RepID=UPI00257A6A11|nr:hypothetical protein [Candidatus Cyanaurora vandensis]